MRSDQLKGYELLSYVNKNRCWIEKNKTYGYDAANTISPPRVTSASPDSSPFSSAQLSSVPC